MLGTSLGAFSKEVRKRGSELIENIVIRHKAGLFNIPVGNEEYLGNEAYMSAALVTWANEAYMSAALAARDVIEAGDYQENKTTIESIIYFNKHIKPLLPKLAQHPNL